jgi:hypothetical protein
LVLPSAIMWDVVVRSDAATAISLHATSNCSPQIWIWDMYVRCENLLV